MAANDVPCCEPMFWVYLITCVALVCFAGLMSGLTLGLMSLSLVDLEVLAKSGQPKDRRNAEKIMPLVKNQHLLLCTLLIYNAMAMEALPIFLDSLLPAWVSVLISVTLILAFGEIIPQAVCSQYGLSVGAKLAVLVRLLVILLLPLSYPISKLLDWLLGKGHSALLRRSELKTFVDLHANEAGKGGELTHDETTIIGGALELSEKTAKDAMTPLSEVFSLDINAKLDKSTMELIMRNGHSRVPIYSGNPANIIGLILVKNLIACRPEYETPIRNLTIRKISRFYDYLPLYDILNQFQKGHFHMGVVVKSERDVKSMPDTMYNPLLSVVQANMVSKPEHSDTKGKNHRLLRKEKKKASRNASVVHSTANSAHTPSMIDAMELGKSIFLQYGDKDILQAPELDFFPDANEEVIGIRTAFQTNMKATCAVYSDEYALQLFYDYLPLYDILNQFQKGHFHMGVVVKSERDVKSMPDTMYNPLLSVVQANMVSKPEHSDTKGKNHRLLRKEKKKASRNASVVHSTANSAHTPSMIDAMELGKSIFLQYGDKDILQAPELDFFPDANEEVIGIITMEDVMEELLQEEIYDETDEYVDVHNRIRINMLSAIRSSPRSSGATPTQVGHSNLRSPVASPLSSYHNTPVLRSPIQPFIPSPLVRPSLLSSPMRSRLASPTTFPGTPTQSSPLKQIPRSSYEKLRQPDH